MEEFNASEKIKDFKKEGNVVYLPHDCCGVAQLVEQLTVNQPVAGSSPAAAANIWR